MAIKETVEIIAGLDKIPKGASKPKKEEAPSLADMISKMARPVQGKQKDTTEKPALAQKPSDVKHDLTNNPPSSGEPRDFATEEDVETPTELRVPSYLMNFPFTIDNRSPNNAWMKGKNEEPINKEKAFSQWMQLYNFVAANSLTYVLPSTFDFQDQVYVANLGIVLPHIQYPTVVMSNYQSPPRQGEEDVGIEFFNMMKYDVIPCPVEYFEGEAELKWLRDNYYIGGYGQRSTPKAFKWFEDSFDMRVIQIKESDEHLYHVDCVVFPLTPESTMVAVDLITPKEIREIEKVTNIIPVTSDQAHFGITNCVRVRNMVLCASELPKMKEKDPDYQKAKDTVDTLNKICVENALEPVFFNLTEFEKSGAALSCCVMHLNRISCEKDVV
jgi:N-dimethylarginine dimethylaminohydrolase